MARLAAIYARVSTDDQAERGYSLPAQIEACEKFATQNGLEVTTIFQDDISGAKPIASRPEGAEMQRALDVGAAGAVIVYRVDRLSRDIVDLLTTVRAWLRAGVAVYALDVGQVRSELDIVLVIKGWQGSDERQKIIERTSSGKYGKAKAGKVVGNGTPPYGYTYANGGLQPDETQAPIVRTIFDLYVNGDENGRIMSFQKIGMHLTQIGVPTPAQAKNWTGKRGSKWGIWETIAVRRIVMAETYCGAWYYGKNIGFNGRGGKRPRSEQVLVNVPPLVSREMWEQAQARRAYNSRIAKRRMKREYLLRGILFCGCGRHMVGGKGRYYCTGRNHTNEIYLDKRSRCEEPGVVGKVIEPLTWNYVMELITDPVVFEDRIRMAQSAEMDNLKPKQAELDHIDALLRQTEREADDVARAAARLRGLVAVKLEQQALEIDRRFHALTARKAELQEALKLELTESMIADLMQFREIVAEGLENPALEDMRRWLELLQVRVTVTHGRAVISCRLHSDEQHLGKTQPTEVLTCRSSP